MKNILVPVDFSAHSAVSCRYALALARPSGDIHLFHTYYDQIMIPDSTFPESIDMSPRYNEGMLREVILQSERKMNQLKEMLQEEIRAGRIEGITLHATITGGEMDQELKEICRNYHPDLVIMGTRGLGKTVNVMGNVATYIIHHAKVPVLTVPESSSLKTLSNIMIAADLTGGNTNCIRTILETFGNYDIRIHCVHFRSRGKEKDDPGKMKALCEKAGELLPPDRFIPAEVEVPDDCQTCIDRFVKENNIDMVAYQPHARSFFYNLFSRNINQKNLFATKLPLLAIPE